MARRQTISQRGGSRANRNWASVISATNVTVPASSKTLLGLLALSNAGIDETVLRVRGSFSITSDQVAATESQIGSVGLIVVSDRAATVGVTAVPGSSTDADDDGWFVHQSFAQQFLFVSAVGVQSHHSTTYDFSSKAKRIVHDGQTIAIMAENIHATFGLQINLQFRMLSMVRGT